MSITKRPGNNKSLSVRALFEIGLHSKDVAILHEIKDFFRVGQVTLRNTRAACSYSVNTIQALKEIIIPHFEKYPLQTQKRVDFEI